MNRTLLTFAGISLLLPAAFGCAGRTAPFDELDKAPITIMRLGQEPPPQAAPAATAPSLIPGIPGLTPEMQQMGNQLLQGAQAAIPGLAGLIPGAQQAQPQQPQAQQLPRFKQFVILGQPIQLNDEDVQTQLLDTFGDEDAFQADHPNCFSPGMGISISRSGQPPVNLMVSLSCNQVQADGFRWPYKVNGLTQDSNKTLSNIFAKFFGPVPPGA